MQDREIEWTRHPGLNGMPISLRHKATGKQVDFDPKVHGVAIRGVSKKTPLHKRAQADMIAQLELMVRSPGTAPV